MKKNLTGILLCTTLATSLLSGCGTAAPTLETSPSSESKTPSQTSSSSNASSSKEPSLKGNITVLTHRTDIVDTKFKDYVTQFNQKYPDVTVKFEAITDYEGNVAIRMSTKEYGDVLMLPNSVPSNEFADFFEPLGTVDELSSKYKEEFLNAKISNGLVYGLASCANAQGVVYNKKVFADAGVTELPTTPAAFLAALKKIKENTEAIPYYTNYAAGWTLTAWQDHAFGSITGDADYHNNILVAEEDPFSPGKPHYILYKLLYDIVAEGLCENDPVTTDWENSKVMLNTGEIGAMMLGSWSISQMMGAGPNPDDIGYMAFPSTLNGKQYATAGADYCYGINVNSKNKEAARAWIDFMVDESGFALSEGSISILKDDPLPDTLKDFVGVEFIVDNPATPENEGKFDELSNRSEIGLYAAKEKQRIVEAALGARNESFDDIMDDWNTRWAKALSELQ